MKRYNGGNKVEGGYYFNLGNWEIVTMKDPGVLPEGEYIRAPMPALLIVAPVLGFGFALFLPFIGFAMAFYAAGKKLTGAGAKVAADVGATVTPAWQPGEAYLAGKPEEKKEGAPKEEKLEALAKEIEEKRAHK